MEREKGFTLMEVIIAMAILSVGLLAIGYMQITAIDTNSTGNRITEGTTLAQDKLEELITYRMTHDDLRESENPHKDETHPGYTIVWYVYDNPTNPADGKQITNAKQIVMTCQWLDRGRQKQTELRCIKPDL
ncbi:MAG: prepilin-type N-terminal cleavage/methylation domain-containing protein [Deltaproteobacteria bacterium]|nr:prepilin-type N-terminal cleavage/methylation domain-containing protein [Deltaproteobacteria bacterium]